MKDGSSTGIDLNLGGGGVDVVVPRVGTHWWTVGIGDIAVTPERVGDGRKSGNASANVTLYRGGV